VTTDDHHTYWVIEETDLVEALHEVAKGADPDEVFMRLSAECEDHRPDDD
jgi:hypothetical protein